VSKSISAIPDQKHKSQTKLANKRDRSMSINYYPQHNEPRWR